MMPTNLPTDIYSVSKHHSNFQAALMWTKKYCDYNGQKMAEVLNGFLDYINFHMIPANVLMKEIHPLGIVPYHIIMNALAYQADPTSVEPIKHTSKEVIIYILILLWVVGF